VEGARASLPGNGRVTLDIAILARGNNRGTSSRGHDLSGIPPGQAGVRGSGTRFCVSGPFPERLPNLATEDPDDTVPTQVETIINGVVVAFRGVTAERHGKDAGVWFPTLPGSTGAGPEPRVIPLYPREKKTAR
jgi:hypothetical protein